MDCEGLGFDGVLDVLGGSPDSDVMTVVVERMVEEVCTDSLRCNPARNTGGHNALVGGCVAHAADAASGLEVGGARGSYPLRGATRIRAASTLGWFSHRTVCLNAEGNVQ